MAELKTVKIKGKEYVEVNERIKCFRTSPNYVGLCLVTDEVILNEDKGTCLIKASVRDCDGNIIASGTAYEKEEASFINKTSFVENCETSAWGRALGNLGIGIDGAVATAEEVQNAILNQKETTIEETIEDRVNAFFEDDNLTRVATLLENAKTLEEAKSIYMQNESIITGSNVLLNLCAQRKKELKGVA